MTNPVVVFFKRYRVGRTSKRRSSASRCNHRCVHLRLFEIVVRHLDLDSLLEFLEQLRLLTETSATKRISDMSTVPHQNLFPMHVVIERIGDMTLGNTTPPAVSCLVQHHPCSLQVLLRHFVHAITFAEFGVASHKYSFKYLYATHAVLLSLSNRPSPLRVGRYPSRYSTR